MRRLYISSVVALGLTIASASNASAQMYIYIGQAVANAQERARETACMSGATQVSQKDFVAAQEGSQRTMLRYLSLAGASADSDVSPVFLRSKEPSFTVDGAAKETRHADDPVARAIGADPALARSADSFIVALDGVNATGRWTFFDPALSTKPLGYYSVQFRYRWGAWKISRLELSTQDAPTSALGPYCHVAGDIEKYLVTRPQNPRFQAELAKNESSHQRVGGAGALPETPN